jgi:hypothetical protein
MMSARPEEPVRAPGSPAVRPCLGMGRRFMHFGHACSYRGPSSKPRLNIELGEYVADNDGGLGNPRRQHTLQLLSINQPSLHENTVQEEFF